MPCHHLLNIHQFIDPAIVLLNIFVILWGLFEWKRIWAGFFLSFLYISIVVGEPVIKRGRVGITLTGLTPPYLCACSKPGPGFPTSYIWVFFCFRWVEVRGDCLFCWYWWNCSPLLFKLYKKKYRCLVILYMVMATVSFQLYHNY
jgi:hypothetical protein